MEISAVSIGSIFISVVTIVTGSQEDENIDYIEEESVSIEPCGTPLKISSHALKLSLIFTLRIFLFM